MRVVLESASLRLAWTDVARLAAPPAGTTTRALAPSDGGPAAGWRVASDGPRAEVRVLVGLALVGAVGDAAVVAGGRQVVAGADLHAGIAQAHEDRARRDAFVSEAIGYAWPVVARWLPTVRGDSGDRHALVELSRPRAAGDGDRGEGKQERPQAAHGPQRSPPAREVRVMGPLRVLVPDDLFRGKRYGVAPEGLEPSHPLGSRILNPLRLPFRQGAFVPITRSLYPVGTWQIEIELPVGSDRHAPEGFSDEDTP
jgi:hypothetical protein